VTIKEKALVGLVQDIIDELMVDGLEGRGKIYHARLMEIIRNMPMFESIEQAREELGHGGL